jgi:hypothetical protein
MIRWYDYVLAVIAADFMVGFFISGASATVWWQTLLYGFAAGMIWEAWSKDYCAYRLRKEVERGE